MSRNITEFESITPTLHETVYVDQDARVIGDVHMGQDSSVWPFAVIRGDVNKIRIGERTSIQDNCTLHVSHDSKFNPGGFALTIGNDVTVGHAVVLHGCTVGDEVLVGIGSIVLDGAVIEKNVILGANSLVPPGKTLESGYLYVGAPAKKIRPLTEAEMENFTYSGQNYANLKNRYNTQNPDYSY